MPDKVVIIGAGPVGSLAALYAAQRGHNVEVYELRPGKSPFPELSLLETSKTVNSSMNMQLRQALQTTPKFAPNAEDELDLRDPSTTPLNFTKSINLALSERGINSLRQTGIPEIVDAVLAETFPMVGRMIHVRKQGKYVQEPQLYDARGKSLLAMDRTVLNKTLLDHLEATRNVKLFFNHKLTGVDFKKKLAWIEKHTPDDSPRGSEIEVEFDFMIGADGAHSAVRYHLMKYVPMAYQQEYIDKLWCQFHIPASSTGDFRLPPNYLHIWPQGDAMFIALPNLDHTFTATLFLPRSTFATLSSSPSAITSFFTTTFPDVLPHLLTPSTLTTQFSTNPHLPLLTLKCSPHTFSASGVLLGDAAHAMVPFYGQGMNAGLEDVRVLFEFLDAYPDRGAALEAYSEQRVPDAHAINDLALRNYREMSEDVRKPMYLLRKKVEEVLDVWVPWVGWKTQYSRVTFGNMRYSEVVGRSRGQARVLNGIVGALVLGIVGVGVMKGGLMVERVRRGFLKGVCWVARGLHWVVYGG
ncbi:FAD/NAD(P)-binding domain-containing protein [Polyplosphaeria fusca]|uniref:Kynurenine 3-monooxygenase n=1 Tax=Polyplosphaeria fusca TaxID=682080 RepID=A0A9P4QRH1_9PLEO|nr:FAD/NAD(P)-binding domain-containing protein [Polyplosphaeria fusca]